MGRWLKRVHECRWPAVGSHGIGSEWECRRCGRVWRLVNKQAQGIAVRATWRGVER